MELDDFLSLGGQLLVPFLFHEVTSLHPSSFQRNDFSTCSTHFSAWGNASTMLSWQQMASFGVHDDLLQQCGTREKQLLRDWPHLHHEWRRLVEKLAQ